MMPYVPPLPDWLALLLIPVACTLLGWLAIRPLITQDDAPHDWLTLLFASLTLGVVIIGWLALVLAEIGRFSLITLGLLWLLLSTLLWLFNRSHSRLLVKSINPHAQIIFLGLWFVATVWLFFRPHQFIRGAADAGVYVNLGAAIVHNGSLLIQDETLAALPAAVSAAFLRPINNPIAPAYLLPGFYVIGEPAGQLTPQFYPLYPVWLAVAFGLGGLGSTLWLTSLWGLLGVVAVYLFARQVAGWPVAALAAVGLSLSAMQVWFARYPTTEMLTQYLLWAGLWATAVWLSRTRSAPLWPILAGASLGSLFLVRIDFIFILPILFLALFWLWLKKQPGVWHFALPLALLVAHSLAHALWQSAPYFVELYDFGVRSLVGNQLVLATLILSSLLGLGLLAYLQLPITRLVMQYQRPLLALAIFALVLLALYAWFIRPYVSTATLINYEFGGNTIPLLDHENFIRLGWYLSPVGIGLGVLGICLLLWRVNRQTALMLAVTLFFSLFYLWKIRNNTQQIYAMRRYIPATLPLFILGGAYVWQALKSLKFRSSPHLAAIIAAVVAVGWLVALGWSARGFVSVVDFVGLPQQLADFNDQLAPDAVLLFNYQAPVNVGDIVGTPLHFLYGHDVFILRQPDQLPPEALVETLANWQANGRSVYWIGDTGWLQAQHVPFQPQETFTITTSRLEEVYDHKPTAVLPVTWELPLVRLEP